MTPEEAAQRDADNAVLRFLLSDYTDAERVAWWQQITKLRNLSTIDCRDEIPWEECQ